MTENRYIETKVTDSGVEPVSLADAKIYMSVTAYDYDDLITELISVARKRVEDFTHLPLVIKTVILTVDVCEPINLPFGKLGTLTSVEYLEGQNTDGTNDWLTLVLADEDYQVLGEDQKEIYSTYTGIHRITYTTGVRSEYGLLLDVKRITNWLFRNRGDEPAAMPDSLFDNSKPYKQYQWG
jgi:hypothetical protein